MCDTNVYLVRGGEEELLMENIDAIAPEGEELVLRDIFGQEKRVRARFREVRLLQHRIILET